LFVALGIFGLAQAPFAEIVHGYWLIITSSDVLVSDYIRIGGLGAAFVNVSLTGIFSLIVLKAAKHEPGGFVYGVLGLIGGIALFGKNPVNMTPIVIGGILYAMIVKKPFSNNVLYTLLASCLAPAVTQLALVEHVPTNLGIVLGILIGILIGLVVIPVCHHLRAAHAGMNLYNVGYGLGIFSIVLMLFFRFFGVDFGPRGYWSEGYDVELIVIMAIISVYFIIVGLLAKNTGSFLDMVRMKTDSIDYWGHYGARTHIAMGVLGLFCLVITLGAGGVSNGPIWGGALSVIGFGGFGKRLFAHISLTIGTLIAAFGAWAIAGAQWNARGWVVAFIFVSCLSPFASKYGWKWGITAGIVHLAIVANLAIFHGGMNLYNNGLAGGIAMMILVPIARIMSKEEAAHH